MTSVLTLPPAADPADALSTASLAQPTTDSRKPYKADPAVPLLALLCGLIYLALAHALGLRLPDLTDPWRSILTASATVGLTFYGAAAVIERRARSSRQKSNGFLVLLCVSYFGWAVLVILIVRDRGLDDALALLLAIAAGVCYPFVAVGCFVNYDGYEACQSGGAGQADVSTTASVVADAPPAGGANVVKA